MHRQSVVNQMTYEPLPHRSSDHYLPTSYFAGLIFQPGDKMTDVEVTQ